MIQKRRKKNTRKSACERLNPSSSTNQRVLRSLFPRTSLFRSSLFSWTWVQLQDGGCSAGTAKKSSHHISGVDLRRNELECTDLVHWTEALFFVDAIIVVGSEKHFDGDFTPDSLSNVGHRGTKAENLAWHSTG